MRKASLVLALVGLLCGTVVPSGCAQALEKSGLPTEQQARDGGMEQFRTWMQSSDLRMLVEAMRHFTNRIFGNLDAAEAASTASAARS